MKKEEPLIEFNHKGDFSKTTRFMLKVKQVSFKDVLNKYGAIGVTALAAATPKDTGATANSWKYTIKEGGGQSRIIWTNSNVVDGAVIAVLLQYGHGTKNGGYVQGQDYINPAIKPIFDNIASDAWKEVTSG